VLVLAEGLLMYLDEADVRRLVSGCAKPFRAVG
jgi:O-methyltransferase involved in polyketide biosynthesis